MSKALRIQKIQISINREQSSNDRRFRETKFDWSSSNRIGIEFAISFGLKIHIFRLVEKNVQSIENMKIHNFFFENLKFSIETQFKTSFHDMKCI